jgi:hypothetical protein
VALQSALDRKISESERCYVADSHVTKLSRLPQAGNTEQNQ